MVNSGRIIRLFAGRIRFTHFVQYLIAFCSRRETASDVLSGRFVGPIFSNKCVKFRYPRLNRYREIPPEAVGSGIFAITFDRKYSY